MATPDEINDGIIEPLKHLFGEPKRNDPTGFYDLIVEVMEPFHAEAFPGAIKAIAIKRKFNSWPSIHEIRKAVEQSNISAGERGDLPRYQEFDRKRKARDRHKLSWDETIAKLKGPMAVDAAQSGWAKELFEHVEEHGELPLPREEDALKEAASKAWRSQEDVLQGQFVTADGEVKPLKGPVKVLQDMAQAMHDREATIAAHILNTNTTKEAG